MYTKEQKRCRRSHRDGKYGIRLLSINSLKRINRQSIEEFNKNQSAYRKAKEQTEREIHESI